MFDFYDVFDVVDDLRRELASWFDDRMRYRRRVSYPLTNIYEDDSNYYVYALVPGLNKDDIDINYDNGNLFISCKRSQEKEDGCIRNERLYGEFNKSINIGRDIDSEKISAKYKDGIIIITLPKREEAKVKKIKVN